MTSGSRRSRRRIGKIILGWARWKRMNWRLAQKLLRSATISPTTMTGRPPGPGSGAIRMPTAMIATPRPNSSQRLAREINSRAASSAGVKARGIVRTRDMNHEKAGVSAPLPRESAPLQHWICAADNEP